MGKVSWTEKASCNLQSIHEYISRDSKTYATRLVKSLIRAGQELEFSSKLGRKVPELEDYGFREIIHQNFRIIYRITDEDNVEILAVVHGARDLQRALGQRE